MLGQSNPILRVLLDLYNPNLGVILGFMKPKIGLGRTFPFWGIPTKITNITHKFIIFNPVWELKKFSCELYQQIWLGGVSVPVQKKNISRFVISRGWHLCNYNKLLNHVL